MKKNLLFVIVAASLCFMSCRVKYGCPSSGRNMGAEKLLSEDPSLKKEIRKAGKFRGGKL